MTPLVFAGSASKKLAGKIVAYNHWELGEHKTVRFANSEFKATIPASVEGKSVLFIQSTANPTDENLMELLLTVDALKREEAVEVNCLVPYFGYARQNMQHLKGECVSMNVVVKMLETVKVDKVWVFDLHEEASATIFSIPFVNLSALPLLAKTIYQEMGVNLESESQYLIGSPDQSGIERARNFAASFYQNQSDCEIIAVEKWRNLNNIHDSEAVELYGNVEGKTVIFVDDIATSGKTVVNAANLCLQKGAVKVIAAIVHPDFGKGVPQFIEDSKLDSFYTTNTIENTLEDLKLFPKIKIVDITQEFKI